jgi:hypothetical protein
MRLNGKPTTERPAIFIRKRGFEESNANKFRKEKAQIIQSGGRPLPHIPHNIPEGKVGKPEGLSGGQTESLNLTNNIPPSKENVNKDRIAAGHSARGRSCLQMDFSQLVLSIFSRRRKEAFFNPRKLPPYQKKSGE